MSALMQISSDFLPTKQNIEVIAESILATVDNGEHDPIKTAIQLEAVKKACETAREKISEHVQRELAKYGKKANVMGATVEEKEVGVKWDYTGSEAWQALKQQRDKIDEKIKAVESIAKSLPEGSESAFTDTDTGETFAVVRGSKTSKTSYAITLGK